MASISACLMHSAKAIDLLEFPKNSSEKYKQIQNLKELSKQQLEDVHEAHGVIAKIYTQLARMGPEWGERDLESHSHLAVTVEILKRNAPVLEQIIDEEEDTLRFFSRVDIVKLCGSELANLGGEKSFKQFATDSFNSLSNQLLQSALRSKAKPRRKRSQMARGAEVLTRILRRGMAPESRAVVLACVNPQQKRLSDTLPALKFVSRIRECVCGEMEKRGIPAFQDSGAPAEDKVEELRKSLAHIVANRDHMTREEFDSLLAEKETALRGMLEKIEEEEDSGGERYEELVLLRDKIAKLRNGEPEAAEERRAAPVSRGPDMSGNESPIPMREETARKSDDLVAVGEELKQSTERNEARIQELEAQVDLLRTHDQEAAESMTKMQY